MQQGTKEFRTRQGAVVTLTSYNSESTGEVRYLTSFKVLRKGKTVSEPITNLQWCHGFTIEKLNDGETRRRFLVLWRGGVESRHFELTPESPTKKNK